ncbi:MAG: hypothetical protein EBY18_00340 [Alphaproteobacteria bacterium]|nr:hypothetical protein [Alphaproteobacteria bacterium]
MMSRSRIGLAASLVLGALAFTAVAAPASAAWWGKDGQWHQDNRWNNNDNNNNRNNDDWNNRYYGYHYREPPVVYGTPYNYGYQPPPVIYDNTPGFIIRIQ